MKLVDMLSAVGYLYGRGAVDSYAWASSDIDRQCVPGGSTMWLPTIHSHCDLLDA